MRLPRMTTRRWMIAVVLIGLNLAAVIAASKRYPRPRVPIPVGFGDGRYFIQYKPDGRIEYSVWTPEGDRVTRVGWSRPRPTLLRIWSPVIASMAISLLALGVASHRMPLPRMTTRRLMIVVPIMAMVIWLTLPLGQIANNPEDDYHAHTYPEVPGSGHESPFWPRYWHLLLGRPWPGGYICPSPLDGPIEPQRGDGP